MNNDYYKKTGVHAYWSAPTITITTIFISPYLIEYAFWCACIKLISSRFNFNNVTMVGFSASRTTTCKQWWRMRQKYAKCLCCVEDKICIFFHMNFIRSIELTTCRLVYCSAKTFFFIELIKFANIKHYFIIFRTNRLTEVCLFFPRKTWNFRFAVLQIIISSIEF